jgi:hypothetical protein
VAIVETNSDSSALEYLTIQLQTATSCSSRYEVLDLAMKHIPGQGLVCEFGVFEADTTNYIAEQLPNRRVFGFDSFEGLPEHWRPSFGPGTFSTGGRLPRVRSNVTLVKGWFEETLATFAAEYSGPVALLHIDCDLYSSSKCAFEHLGERLVPGSVIVFDEFFNYPGWEEHEFRAFSEFVAARRLRHEYLAYNGQHEQVAVRVTG